MNHLRSSFADLHDLFGRSITVRHIAEPLCSFDDSSPAQEVREFMVARDFDVIGVREHGVISGYALRHAIVDGPLGGSARVFETAELLQESTSMLEAINALREVPQVFIVIRDQVWGILMRGDLQKAPVRMWLFGLISLLEMHFLRLVRLYHPNEAWQSMLKPNRISQARKILAKRQARNEAIDLADCLQFCDKRDILIQTPDFLERNGLLSKTAGDKLLKEIEVLRNELAHAQDIIGDDWQHLVELASMAEKMLLVCESIKTVGG